MSIRAYLPSTQFMVIVVSLVLAGGLVALAQYVTHKPQGSLASTDQPVATQDWQTQLNQIEAQSGISLPQTPDPQTVSSILAQAKTSSLTDTVAHSLLINLVNAKAQGLGDDAPTQDAIVSQAMAQIDTSAAQSYTAANIEMVPQTNDSLHTYGNALSVVFASHSNANAQGLLLLFGYMLDYNETKMEQPIKGSGQDYTGLAKDIAQLPVPQTLAPLQLELANDLATMGQAATAMSAALTDPAQGMLGLRQFESLANESTRVLTTIVSTFSKDGILFTKDEPGSAWAAFSASAQTPQSQ